MTSRSARSALTSIGAASSGECEFPARTCNLSVIYDPYPTQLSDWQTALHGCGNRLVAIGHRAMEANCRLWERVPATTLARFERLDTDPTQHNYSVANSRVQLCVFGWLIRARKRLSFS